MKGHPRRIHARKQVIRKIIARKMNPEEKEGRKVTANPTSIAIHGRPFLTRFGSKRILNGKFYVKLIASTHESPLAVGLFDRTGKPIGTVKIGFAPHTIVIEHFKGFKAKKENEEIVHATGKPWPFVLIKFIEEHAKERGYTHALFRRVETQHTYKHPITGFEDSAREDLKIKETRDEMGKLWGTNARKLGYRNINREFKGKKL